jgi:peroxiredoxin Q/BCP
MEMKLKIGDRAPEFRAAAVGGKYGAGQDIKLSDFRGKRVILYFYPKDNTPGCTTQACGLRDAWEEVKDSAQIFGVSVDPTASHQKFIDKFRLPFPLLSDSDKKIVKSYGAWVKKNFLGKKYMGTERRTFVIDPEGHIEKIFRKVRPDEHVDLLRQFMGHENSRASKSGAECKSKRDRMLKK